MEINLPELVFYFVKINLAVRVLFLCFILIFYLLFDSILLQLLLFEHVVVNKVVLMFLLFFLVNENELIESTIFIIFYHIVIIAPGQPSFSWGCEVREERPLVILH